MDGLIYPVSLIIIALLAFVFNQNNNRLLMFLVLAIGAYIIYSHETGRTATDFKNEMIESIDESAKGFSKSYETDVYDSDKAEKKIK